MKILVFLHGTIIVHKNAEGHTREEIVQQVINQEESVRDFASHMPIGNAAEKLRAWAAQGAEICYLSALTENKKARGDELVGRDGLKPDEIVLKKYDFPPGIIYHREPNEKYQDVVARISPLPDVLIEDDCESIGGEKEMTHPSLKQGLKERIHSVVVKEFQGIDHLPDDINSL